MNRIKKQLREWDENLSDDSLPANPIGMEALSLPWPVASRRSNLCFLFNETEDFRFFFFLNNVFILESTHFPCF